MSMAVAKSVVAVVDDDERLLESLENLLESAGHRVLTFTSSKRFVEEGIAGQIDCLVADIGMPGIDGFELQRLAKEARPDLPVILITGRHEIADQQRALVLGHEGFFRKPFDVQALLAAIERALFKTEDQHGDG